MPDGPKKRKQQGRTGHNGLSYMGVEPMSPTNYVTFEKDPTVKDYNGWYLGDEWENRLTLDVWKLVLKDAGVATWIKFGHGTAGAMTNLIDDAANVVLPGATHGITLGGGININTTSAANTLTVNLDQGTSPGEILITNTATGIAEWNTITEGAGVNIVSDNGVITISAGGAGGDITFDCDVNTATSVAGAIQFEGIAGNIVTTGDTNDLVTIDVGDFIASSYLTDDANSAVPSASVLTIAGGQNLNTESAGSTVTVNVNDIYGVSAGATQSVVVVDNTQALGSATDILISTDGEITKPRNPAFRAFLHNENNVTGDGTIHYAGSAVAMTVSYDIGNNFYPGNGSGSSAVFTAPISGVYMIEADVSVDIGSTGGYEFGWHFEVSGFNHYAGFGGPTKRRCTGFYGTNGFIITNGSFILKLSAGDPVKLALTSIGGSKVDALEYCSIAGILLS